MNIKRKISISNLLMLLVPALLIAAIAAALFLVFGGIIRIRDTAFYYDSELFWRQTGRIDALAASWSANRDLRSIESEIDRYNAENAAKGISLSFYDGGRLVYPALPGSALPGALLLQAVAEEGQSHSGTLDDKAFYSRKIGGFAVVALCSHYIDIGANFEKYEGAIKASLALLALLLISVICVTDYFLTRSIYRSIAVPLDILGDGVHQIRLGNYRHRIDYGKQDEFSAVCADFNLMAKRLQRSVELEEKDESNRNELIAGISHDLRTPLTSIRAYVDGLIDGIADSPEMRRSYLETIKSKAESIDRMVDRLFLFSKLNMGEFPFYLETLDIGVELADFVAATSDEYLGRGLEEKLTRNTSGVLVSIDPIQFREVLTNILENSAKYRQRERGLMEMACVEEGDAVRITLTDDGPGVPAAALDKIFDAFFRNDPSRNNPSKGSGLGLAITSKIIERLGGSIAAENAPGGGLRIVIVLPACGRAGEKR